MKQYNGEKAIISLTSWKARINTVGLTLFSLYKRCPGFHIVLVLSEEEFPKKEAELPDSVMAFVNQDLIELLWVYENTKSFKKVLPTMEKYKDVPVISADDDCIYKYNYAEELYTAWVVHKNAIISFYAAPYKDVYITGGYATLYPAGMLSDRIELINRTLKRSNKIFCYGDDPFYAAINHAFHLASYHILNKRITEVCITHNEINPLHNEYNNLNKTKIMTALQAYANRLKRLSP